jgi:hypothetical protein
VAAWETLNLHHPGHTQDWFPTIEANLAEGLFRSQSKTLPRLQKSLYRSVCAPPRKMPKEASPEELRKWRPEPGFEDTLETWRTWYMKTTGSAPADWNCNVILVTSGPVWDRYGWITEQTFLGCSVFSVGYATPPSLNLGQYLNEVSMLLHECSKWFTMSTQGI